MIRRYMNAIAVYIGCAAAAAAAAASLSHDPPVFLSPDLLKYLQAYASGIFSVCPSSETWGEERLAAVAAAEVT
jgi:hypothetical protein